MEFRLRKGRDFDLGAPPGGGPVVPCRARVTGLTAQDYPGVTFDLRVGEDDSVRRGQILCVDRRRPDIAFVASVAGRVSRIGLGARRRVETVEVTAAGEDGTRFVVGPAQGDDAALRALLLESGAWVAFRTRPFGRIPDPSARPSAIFVTATDSRPLAPDPAHVLAPRLDDFRRGVAAMLRLTDGPVFVCQAPGPPLAPPVDRLRVARFSGPHPAGLAGTHIHRLWPVSARRSVWQIGYQDVAAIGVLLETGEISAQRTLSVAGPGLGGPARLMRAPLGVELAELLETAGTGPDRTPEPNPDPDPDSGPDPDPGAMRLISGSVLEGRAARYLGRHDLQVTVLNRRGQALRPPSALARLLDRLPRAASGVIEPSEAFEQVFPFDLLPVPLMRALAARDIETTQRLGGLELLEEDLALLSWRCPSGCDYGQFLRQFLDILHEESAA